MLRGDVQRSWDFALNPEIAIDLEAALAVGEADLDLSGLRLSALKVGTAVSHARIRLPVEGNLKATIAGAIGEIEIIVPKGMAVRVDSSTALGSTNAPASYARNGPCLYLARIRQRGEQDGHQGRPGHRPHQYTRGVNRFW